MVAHAVREMVGKRTLWRFALAMLAAAAFGGPALAAPAAPELAAWVSEHTDLAPTQIAIAGSDNVYSLEALGPPAATGEVVARVRTEAVDAGWSAAHGLKSWEAHVLFDCDGRRVRIIRSASYPERNLQGAPKTDDNGGSWFTPKPSEPAATLLSAACDRDFAWPLREAAKTAAADTADEPSAAAASKTTVVKASFATPEAAKPPATAPPEAATEAPDKPSAQPDRRPIARQAAGPAAAVVKVRQLAGVGQSFVSRRAASVGRWLAWRSTPRPPIQQASL